MRTRVFVVPLFAANLPRALTCSDSSSTPLFTFFRLCLSISLSIAGTTFFFPENVLPTVISVINGRPLTTRFILDQRFVSKGKDRLWRQMWDLVPGQRISSTILYCDTVSLYIRTYNTLHIFKVLMRFRLGD